MYNPASISHARNALFFISMCFSHIFLIILIRKHMLFTCLKYTCLFLDAGFL
jgi:hypothetical protein